MIRSLVTVVRPVAALVIMTAGFLAHDATAAVFGLVAAITLFVWAATDIDWSLVGRPRRVDGITATRTVRRVLTVLLADADGVGAAAVCRLADVGMIAALACLDHFEMAGWTTAEWGPEPTFGVRPRHYQLTPGGRAHALELLGLTESARPVR